MRQRVYLHRAARERLERTNRETERAARDAYLGVFSEISRVRATTQALESSRTALQATEAGFEVGTRTTVDVLDARRQLFQAQTNYSRSRYDYILNVLQLQLADRHAGSRRPGKDQRVPEGARDHALSTRDSTNSRRGAGATSGSQALNAAAIDLRRPRERDSLHRFTAGSRV